MSKKNKIKILSAREAAGTERKLPKRKQLQAAAGYDPLPDPMNASGKTVGAEVEISSVGVSNLQIPFRVYLGKALSPETRCNFKATVSLAREKRGINMSRILRVLCEQDSLNRKSLEKLVLKLVKEMESKSAVLRAEFSFPLKIKSLRSIHSAFQYYNAALEARFDKDGKISVFNELEFVYSSACPCSAELSEHAMRNRAVNAIPHSQRSTAKLRVRLSDKSDFMFEELVQLCRNALVTETQMIVRRQDEQAFAELNGANQKFVEDAVRLLYLQLDSSKKISAFSVDCAHYESLHAHDAVASISSAQLPLC